MRMFLLPLPLATNVQPAKESPRLCSPALFFASPGGSHAVSECASESRRGPALSEAQGPSSEPDNRPRQALGSGKEGIRVTNR